MRADAIKRAVVGYRSIGANPKLALIAAEIASADMNRELLGDVFVDALAIQCICEILAYDDDDMFGGDPADVSPV